MADCHPDRKHWAHGLCQSCVNAEYRSKNRERLREQGRTYATERRDPAAHREAQARYYKAHRDTHAASRASWFAAHGDLVPFMRAAVAANAASRRIGAGERVGYKDLMTLPRVCAYCGSTTSLSVDHMTPLSRGGRNHISNLTTACLSCNGQKANLTVDEFRYARLGR